MLKEACGGRGGLLHFDDGAYKVLDGPEGLRFTEVVHLRAATNRLRSVWSDHSGSTREATAKRLELAHEPCSKQPEARVLRTRGQTREARLRSLAS